MYAPTIDTKYNQPETSFILSITATGTTIANVIINDIIFDFIILFLKSHSQEKLWV